MNAGRLSGYSITSSKCLSQIILFELLEHFKYHGFSPQKDPSQIDEIIDALSYSQLPFAMPIIQSIPQRMESIFQTHSHLFIPIEWKKSLTSSIKSHFYFHNNCIEIRC